MHASYEELISPTESILQFFPVTAFLSISSRRPDFRLKYTTLIRYFSTQHHNFKLSNKLHNDHNPNDQNTWKDIIQNSGKACKKKMVRQPDCLFSSKYSNMIQVFQTLNMQTQTPLIQFLLSNIRSTSKLGVKTW